MRPWVRRAGLVVVDILATLPTVTTAVVGAALVEVSPLVGAIPPSVAAMGAVMMTLVTWLLVVVTTGKVSSAHLALGGAALALALVAALAVVASVNTSAFYVLAAALALAPALKAIARAALRERTLDPLDAVVDAVVAGVGAPLPARWVLRALLAPTQAGQDYDGSAVLVLDQALAAFDRGHALDLSPLASRSSWPAAVAKAAIKATSRVRQVAPVGEVDPVTAWHEAGHVLASWQLSGAATPVLALAHGRGEMAGIGGSTARLFSDAGPLTAAERARRAGAEAVTLMAGRAGELAHDPRSVGVGHGGDLKDYATLVAAHPEVKVPCEADALDQAVALLAAHEQELGGLAGHLLTHGHITRRGLETLLGSRAGAGGAGAGAS